MTYQKFRLSIDKLLKEEEAATAVEYAVILMLIAGALISTLQLMGGSTAAFWQSNTDQVERVLSR